jgi:hypothetical protein
MGLLSVLADTVLQIAKKRIIIYFKTQNLPYTITCNRQEFFPKILHYLKFFLFNWLTFENKYNPAIFLIKWSVT